MRAYIAKDIKTTNFQLRVYRVQVISPYEQVNFKTSKSAYIHCIVLPVFDADLGSARPLLKLHAVRNRIETGEIS